MIPTMCKVVIQNKECDKNESHDDLHMGLKTTEKPKCSNPTPSGQLIKEKRLVIVLQVDRIKTLCLRTYHLNE